MSINTLADIEKRIAEVEASYRRQLALSRTIRYDHSLTEFLKKDLDWLRRKKNELLEGRLFEEENGNKTVEK